MNPEGLSVESVVPDEHGRFGFVSACAVAFIGGVAATVYFGRSMCCEMEMAGGWTMSMMWTRMRGQTWEASAISFLLMWLAMMVAMMLPSALPMFLDSRRRQASRYLVAMGYFSIWLAVGAGVYVVGIALAATALHWESFSRAIPALSGALLIAAGVFQFTRWKMIGLRRCRSSSGCVGVCPERAASFRLGCQQGAACCVCCAAPMMVQLTLGVMSPVVMIGVALIIAAEKLLPRPEIVARLVAIAVIAVGICRVAGILISH